MSDETPQAAVAPTNHKLCEQQLRACWASCDVDGHATVHARRHRCSARPAFHQSLHTRCTAARPFPSSIRKETISSITCITRTLAAFTSTVPRLFAQHQHGTHILRRALRGENLTNAQRCALPGPSSHSSFDTPTACRRATPRRAPAQAPGHVGGGPCSGACAGVSSLAAFCQRLNGGSPERH